RKLGIGREVGPWRSRGEDARALGRIPRLLAVADEIDRALQPVPVDDDSDAIALDELADGSASECFGGDVPDAGPGGNAGEAGVGHVGEEIAGPQLVLSCRR